MPDPIKGSPEDAALRRQINELTRRQEAQFAKQQAFLDEREAVLHAAAMKLYATKRIAEECEPREGHVGIAPELRDLIKGDTQAEIEASIATMVKKTAEILEGLEIAGYGTPPATSEPAGSRQLGPEEEAAQIAAAGPYSREFQEWRAVHVPSASRGLF